jgi:peptidoglycan/LPS O-acetylase OafA/YrhL
MSGFVIAKSYEARLLSGSMSFLAFCIVRFVRLYPLYFMGMAAGVAYLMAKSSLGVEGTAPMTSIWIAMLYSALFLPQFSSHHDLSSLFPFDPAAWSLSLEVAVNIVYAVWLFRQSLRTLCIVVAVSAAALTILGLQHGSLDLGWGASTAFGGVARIMFSFTLGVILYRSLGVIPLPPNSVYPTALIIVLTIVLVAPIGDRWISYDLACVFVVFPAFLLAAARLEPGKRSVPTYLLAGRLSYGIYILHDSGIMWISGVWKVLFKTDVAQSGPLAGIAMATVILAMTYLVTVYIDEPLRMAWRKTRSARVSAHPMVSNPAKRTQIDPL